MKQRDICHFSLFPRPSFSELRETASALTEQLRRGDGTVDDVLLMKVENAYKLVTDSIQKESGK